jgi:hypothetical protein
VRYIRRGPHREALFSLGGGSFSSHATDETENGLQPLKSPRLLFLFSEFGTGLFLDPDRPPSPEIDLIFSTVLVAPACPEPRRSFFILSEVDGPPNCGARLLCPGCPYRESRRCVSGSPASFFAIRRNSFDCSSAHNALSRRLVLFILNEMEGGPSRTRSSCSASTVTESSVLTFPRVGG